MLSLIGLLVGIGPRARRRAGGLHGPARSGRGDGLWKIGRRTYGAGDRYAVIDDANRSRIRGPGLIDPGQIFVRPAEDATMAEKDERRGRPVEAVVQATPRRMRRGGWRRAPSTGVRLYQFARKQILEPRADVVVSRFGFLAVEKVGRVVAGVDRHELRQIVAGLSEGVILVEPDQTIAYANAAALAMHGAESLGELGETVEIYRERFALRYRNNHTPNQYPMERVVSGERFHDVIVDVKRTDRPGVDFVHSLRSLVATDHAGTPSCLALILKDVSEQFEAEDRFETTFNANPAPAVITRLSDLRHVKVNTGFLEMTGYTRDAVIGRSVYEVDVLANARNRDLAVNRLNAGATIPQMEACLDLPDGGTRFVIVAGQPMELGDEPCMLFTFADLELRKKAETALRQSEERFAKAFRLTPVPTLLARADGFGITGVNDAFARVFGYAADAVLGRSPAEFGLWVHDAARSKFETALLRTGFVLGLEVCLRHEDGTNLDCLASAERVEIGDAVFALLVLQDITDRKRSERDMFEAVEAVMADTSWFSRGLIEKLANLRRPGTGHKDGIAPNITVRERQILDLICQGQGDEAIAKRLNLSKNTVRNHSASLYRKLNVHKRTEAIVWGRDNGFPLSPTEK